MYVTSDDLALDAAAMLAETTDHFSYEPLRSRQAAVASLVAAAVEVTSDDAKLGGYIRRLVAAYNAAEAADDAGYFASGTGREGAPPVE